MIVHGNTVDDQTRCVHYATATDVIAIRFFCCLRYYPCHRCHEESEDHTARRWPRADFGKQAILCGVCQTELSITRYFAVSACPSCQAPFNEGCRLHRHFYFDD